VQVICWVVGEYGTLSARSVESIMDRLAAIPDTQTATEEVRLIGVQQQFTCFWC
jgi:hypothetical protein